MSSPHSNQGQEQAGSRLTLLDQFGVREVRLRPGLTLGRFHSCNVQVEHPEVEHVHARVVKREDGGFLLQCEPRVRLRMIAPENTETGRFVLEPGVAFKLGDSIFFCRQQNPDDSGQTEPNLQMGCPICRVPLAIMFDTSCSCPNCGAGLFFAKTPGFNGWLPCQLGDYRVLGYAGGGSSGIVLKGNHTVTSETVALKLLKPGLRGEGKWERQFEQEVELLKQLSHPNLTRFLASGTVGTLQWVATEWIEGMPMSRNIRHLRDNDQQLKIDEVRYFLEPLARALKYLHERGIVHRDLKPGNVLLGFDGAIRIGDLGSAGATLDEDAEAPRTVMTATIQYMAPEQLWDGGASFSADVFALGKIWHELLTGYRPAEEMDLESLRPDCPPAWVAAIAACQEDDPEKRPTADDLLKVLHGEDLCLSGSTRKKPWACLRNFLASFICVVAIYFSAQTISTLNLSGEGVLQAGTHSETSSGRQARIQQQGVGN